VRKKKSARFSRRGREHHGVPVQRRKTSGGKTLADPLLRRSKRNRCAMRDENLRKATQTQKKSREDWLLLDGTGASTNKKKFEERRKRGLSPRE